MSTVPFAAAIEMAVRRQVGWWRVTATGTAVTFGWIVLLRWVPQLLVMSGVTCVLVALTLAAKPAATWWRGLQPVLAGVQEPSDAWLSREVRAMRHGCRARWG